MMRATFPREGGAHDPCPMGWTSSNPTTSMDIVDTAIANGNFKTLLGAVQGAGLEATLRGPGPFTVFAPTDAAFEKIPSFFGSFTVFAPTDKASADLKAALGEAAFNAILADKGKLRKYSSTTCSPPRCTRRTLRPVKSIRWRGQAHRRYFRKRRDDCRLHARQGQHRSDGFAEQQRRHPRHRQSVAPPGDLMSMGRGCPPEHAVKIATVQQQPV
jgi:hypothetical protein